MPTTTVDGVTTIWEDLPGPLTASLVFGVGVRHETFRTREVTHMIEHLVMSTVTDGVARSNASVDEDTTVFGVVGCEADVVRHLSEVCTSLRNPPLERLSLEAGILRLEDSAPAAPSITWGVNARYGARGLGVLGSRGPSPDRLTEEHVSSYVNRHFVRDNAVLVLSGPPPEGLRLDLLDGPRPPELSPRTVPFVTPALVDGPGDRPAVSGLVSRSDAAATLTSILVERLHRSLRLERGLVYDVDADTVRVDEDTSLVVLHADPAEEHAERVLRDMWDEIGSIADHGVSDEELLLRRQVFELYAQTTEAAEESLRHHGYRWLYGGPSHALEATRASLGAVTSDHVRAEAQRLRGTAVLGLPTPPSDPIPGVTDQDESRWHRELQVEGATFHGKALRGRRGALRAVAGDEGFALTAHGRTSAFRWEDVVGVGAAPTTRQLSLADGGFVWVCTRHLRKSTELFEIIDRHTADVTYELHPHEVVDC